MNRRRALSLLTWSPLLSRTIAAQESSNAASFPYTRAFLRKFVTDGQANGAISCVFRNGKTEFETTEGWLDVGHRTPMRRDAIFNIASLSKPIAGVSAMILIEQGKIRLEDPISRWIPELARRAVLRKPDGPLNDTYPAAREITVADLLFMHMGLGASGPEGPFADALKKIAIEDAPGPDVWLKQLAELPLQFAPGESWLGDTPVDVLGMLIRRVTGGSLYAFQKEFLFGPLGMKDTGYFVPAEKLDRVAAWPPEGGKPLQKSEPKVESAGDGLYSTMPDYLSFARMLLNRGELGGKRLLKATSIVAMTTDRMGADEHRSGVFAGRFPGLGFGYTLGVRTVPLEGGPSVGSFNWYGSTGVWFLADPARQVVTVFMTQHPAKGTNARTGVNYISRSVENDLYQAAVYADLISK